MRHSRSVAENSPCTVASCGRGGRRRGDLSIQGHNLWPNPQVSLDLGPGER